MFKCSLCLLAGKVELSLVLIYVIDLKQIHYRQIPIKMFVSDKFSCLPLAEGCGVGGGVYVRTLEAVPEGLLPPRMKAAGASVLEINWSEPEKPNGLIISYHIYR